MKIKKLESIHSNVCGPMFVESIGGHRYIITFIDDATWKVWVCPIHKKDRVLGNSRYFKFMSSGRLD